MEDPILALHASQVNLGKLLHLFLHLSFLSLNMKGLQGISSVSIRFYLFLFSEANLPYDEVLNISYFWAIITYVILYCFLQFSLHLKYLI